MKILKATAPVREIAATGMRDVRQLLKSGVTCDRLADFTFRSGEEIAFFLNGLDNVVIPITASISPETLSAAYTSLCSLQNKLDVLDAMSVTIAYEFRKDCARLLPMLASVRTGLENKRNIALKTMQKAARKQAPADLTKAAAEIQALVSNKLGKSYASVKDFVFVTGKDDALCFNHYFQYSSLQNKTQGYTYPEYFVVVSALVKEGAVQLHANTLHKFYAPGAFNLGERLEPRRLNLTVNRLLAADEFIKTKV